jgi:hypothetical protein
MGSVALAVLAGACSSQPTEARKPVHPVRGKVLYKGQPAKGAFVLLAPLKEPAENPDPRPRGTVGDDGTFVLGTYEREDGAPAGEYTVAITWEGGVLPDGREEPTDKLHGRYDLSNTRLKATVKEGPNELPPFQLQ